MNRFAKREGLAAKQLSDQGEKTMQINEADVAELVDARDLKSRVAAEDIGLSCKTHSAAPADTAGVPAHLQNIPLADCSVVGT